ncbi:hypothetical protein DAPK24_023730 [Pichia kluyveri]|uniref:DUF7907 domain-containing protein n=1 Tax=Pichia kluyveri TaxID=36015 RepID=A0AAV5R2M8_PICKL|nr:hypothetical protein DAPK24_023730 [Pichia kluyveri]
MLFKNSLIIAASAAVATAAEDVYLVIKSDNSTLNGNTLGFNHEGAGINYAFLGTAPQSEPLSYDADAETLLGTSTIPQTFDVSKYVAITVAGTNSKYSFADDNTLLVNGTAGNFYACMNTNDPYNYSQSGYELMYYKEDAPSDCISVDVQRAVSNNGTGSSSSVAPSTSVLPSTTLSSSSSESPIPTTTDAPNGANQFAPAGALVAAAGIAAALL